MVPEPLVQQFKKKTFGALVTRMVKSRNQMRVSISQGDQSHLLYQMVVYTEKSNRLLTSLRIVKRRILKN